MFILFLKLHLKLFFRFLYGIFQSVWNVKVMSFSLSRTVFIPWQKCFAKHYPTNICTTYWNVWEMDSLSICPVFLSAEKNAFRWSKRKEWSWKMKKKYRYELKPKRKFTLSIGVYSGLVDIDIGMVRSLVLLQGIRHFSDLIAFIVSDNKIFDSDKWKFYLTCPKG